MTHSLINGYPAHDSVNIKDSKTIIGRVIEQQRGTYQVRVSPNEILRARCSGRLLHDATSKQDLPAVGDYVQLDLPLDLQMREGRVVSVLPRHSCLVRKSAGETGELQVIAANIDVVMIVTSMNKELNVRRIERYLAAIWESGAVPAVALTKIDLCADRQEFRQIVNSVVAGVPVLEVSALTGEGLDSFRGDRFLGRTIAFVGSSGVGKSTLVNALVGHDALAVREISAMDDKGRHTTTSRSLWEIPGGGAVIDTPGMREFMADGLGDGLNITFVDLETMARDCRFSNCQHGSEPGCLVQQAIMDGVIPAARLASWRKLQREQAWLQSRSDVRKRQEIRNKWKKNAKIARSKRK